MIDYKTNSIDNNSMIHNRKNNDHIEVSSVAQQTPKSWQRWKRKKLCNIKMLGMVIIIIMMMNSIIPTFDSSTDTIDLLGDNIIDTQEASNSQLNHENSLVDAKYTYYSADDWWRGRDTNITHIRNHPHQGAKFNGLNGMIVNPSPDRLEKVMIGNKVRVDTIENSRSQHVHISEQSVKSDMVCPSDTSYGIESEGGNKVLQKIKGGLQKSINFLNENDGEGKRKRRSKILCMVFSVYTPQSQHVNLRAQAHTWGKRCDGFIGSSNMTDHSVGAIELLHMGEEVYGNMWQKVRSMWAYAYDHYKDEYDFFYICGDDVYVAVENLRAYVDGPEVERLENGYVDKILSFYINQTGDKKKRRLQQRPRPLLFGTPLFYQGRPNPDGGSGYMMNRAALEILGTQIDHFLHNSTDPREDLFIGGLFVDQGVYLVDTRNANDGGLRFSYSAEFSWGHGKKYPSPLNPKFLKEKYGFEIKEGIDTVSEDQISFHLKDWFRGVIRSFSKAELMYRYDAILYDLC